MRGLFFEKAEAEEKPMKPFTIAASLERLNKSKGEILLGLNLGFACGFCGSGCFVSHSFQRVPGIEAGGFRAEAALKDALHIIFNRHLTPPSAATCCGGRQVLVEANRSEVEEQFRRIVTERWRHEQLAKL